MIQSVVAGNVRAARSLFSAAAMFQLSRACFPQIWVDARNRIAPATLRRKISATSPRPLATVQTCRRIGPLPSATSLPATMTPDPSTVRARLFPTAKNLSFGACRALVSNRGP